MSILTSNVWNNKINIKLVNILVHSRSKMEVFFWPYPPFPNTHAHTHTPSSGLHKCIVCTGWPNPSSASGWRKSTFPRWVFFKFCQRCCFSGHPGDFSDGHSGHHLAGSFGTIFHLPSPISMPTPPTLISLISLFQRHYLLSQHPSHSGLKHSFDTHLLHFLLLQTCTYFTPSVIFCNRHSALLIVIL